MMKHGLTKVTITDITQDGDRAVGRATLYGLDGTGFDSWGKQSVLSTKNPPTLALEPTQTPPVCTGSLPCETIGRGAVFMTHAI